MQLPNLCDLHQLFGNIQKIFNLLLGEMFQEDTEKFYNTMSC